MMYLFKIINYNKKQNIFIYIYQKLMPIRMMERLKLVLEIDEMKQLNQYLNHPIALTQAI
jgi:hypothetical protein